MSVVLQTISLAVRKSKVKPLTDFLKTVDFVEVNEEDKAMPTFLKGDYKENENPLKDFAGIWKDREIDANELRRKAWQRK